MIYCVEDDDDIRELMLYTLRTTGYEAQGFADGESFWEVVSQKPADLILLDIMLPGEDGIHLLARLRSDSRTMEIPVIMATAKGTEFDKVKGLDMGADDYLVKPFGMMEMVSRVKAVLRRTQNSQDAEILTCGMIRMDSSSHTVAVDGQSIDLTLKEYELLHAFMKRPGMVYTRDQLLNEIWGMEYDGETRTVDVHIRTLRSKLGKAGGCISTVRGIGYRMEVEPV